MKLFLIAIIDIGETTKITTTSVLNFILIFNRNFIFQRFSFTVRDFSYSIPYCIVTINRIRSKRIPKLIDSTSNPETISSFGINLPHSI